MISGVKIIILNFIVIFFLIVGLRSQPVPPRQDYVYSSTYGNQLYTSASPLLSLKNSFTIEGWLYFVNYNPSTWIAGKFGSNTGKPDYVDYGLTTYGDGSKLEFYISTGGVGYSAFLISNSSIQLNTWTHVAIVYDGNSVNLYLNGILDSSYLFKGPIWDQPSVPFSICQGLASDGSYNWMHFPGYMSNWRIWSIARTPSQISANMVRLTTQDTAGLIADWPMDESSGTYYRDISSNGLNLYFYGNYTCLLYTSDAADE